MARIQKMSSYLLMILNFLMLFFPLFLLSVWTFINTAPLHNLIAKGMLLDPIRTPEGIINLAAVIWTPLTQAMGFMADLIGILPLLLGIFVLRSIFRSYQNGEIFTLTNARHYQYLGWLFFVDAFLTTPLSTMLMTLAVTFTNPPGHRWIEISLGTPALNSIFCGVLVLVISWIMGEASKLQQDQQLTI